MAVLIVFLAFYLVLSLFFGGLIIYSFYDTADNTEIYSLRVVYDDRVLHKLSAEKANNEFGLYVPFSHLAEIGSFGIAGDGDEATFFIMGSDNRIQCTINSSLMIINDNPVRISAPLLYEDGEYLIPVVLLENYVNGLDIVYDNDGNAVDFIVCTDKLKNKPVSLMWNGNLRFINIIGYNTANI